MANPSCPRDSAPFSRLHLRHEQATFPHVCEPPSASETMCSSSGALSSWVPRLLLGVLVPHRWQRHLSRSNTLMGSMLWCSTPRMRARRLAFVILRACRLDSSRWLRRHPSEQKRENLARRWLGLPQPQQLNDLSLWLMRCLMRRSAAISGATIALLRSATALRLRSPMRRSALRSTETLASRAEKHWRLQNLPASLPDLTVRSTC